MNTKEEMIQLACDISGNSNLAKIWEGKVPRRIKHICQDPTSLYESYCEYPEMFPSPDRLCLIWQTNSDSIVGYLDSYHKFIKYSFEDGPDSYESIGGSYQQLVGVVMARLVSADTSSSDLDEVAGFLKCIYLVEIINYVKSNSDWEDSVASYIEHLER